MYGARSVRVQVGTCATSGFGASRAARLEEESAAAASGDVAFHHGVVEQTEERRVATSVDAVWGEVVGGR